MWRTKFTQMSLFVKLALINAMALGAVVLWSGSAIKDYACLLVNDYEINGPILNSELHIYFLQISIIAFSIVFLLYFLFLKRLIDPLKNLTQHAAFIKKGVFPEPLPVTSQDELGKLSEAFNNMAQTLKKNDEKRDQMLKDISHELRTPLTNLNGYLEGLQTGIIEPTPALYGILLKESKRLTRMAEQINQLEGWTNFHQESQMLPVQKVIEDALDSFNLSFEKAGISVDSNIEKGNVYASEDALKQVMSIMLENVCFYDEGSWVKIIGAVRGKMYRIEWHNKGQFIDPDHSEKVFERFYRADFSRTLKTGGSGLGLSIAKEIITMAGGRIGLQTDGTEHCFWAEIPLSDKEEF
ncbi:HAMP domain-containing protein [Fictibacillus sp. b24]|nr:ATP-binding protein [Fictibacillus sp. b24]MDM5317875.1 HAMP domain-containing protein [Fictibacillus sp. b24]